MKKKVLLLSLLMVFCFTLGAFGATKLEWIQVALNSVSVEVNGKPTQASTIIYEGITYVPVSFVARELGAKSQWDSANRKVIITGQAAQASVAPQQPAQVVQPTQAEQPKTTNKVSFSSLEDFETYLDKNFGKISTPIGELTVVYDIRDYRNDNFLPYDFSITGRFSEGSWTKITKGLGQAGAKAVKEHMKKVSDVAMESFPDKKMEGYYYTSWYEYPSVQVGYKSTRFYEWRNYKLDYDKPGKAAGRVSSFQWEDDSEMTEKIWFKY